jgi:hypothetical protein
MSFFSIEQNESILKNVLEVYKDPFSSLLPLCQPNKDKKKLACLKSNNAE